MPDQNGSILLLLMKLYINTSFGIPRWGNPVINSKQFLMYTSSIYSRQWVFNKNEIFSINHILKKTKGTMAEWNLSPHGFIPHQFESVSCRFLIFQEQVKAHSKWISSLILRLEKFSKSSIRKFSSKNSLVSFFTYISWLLLKVSY